MAHAEAHGVRPRGRGAARRCSGSPTRRRSPGSSPRASRSGIGEAGNFPAAIKTVAEWFPKKERALRDRHFQLGHQHRRAGHAAGRAVDDRDVRLGLGVHRDRRARVLLAARCGCRCSARPDTHPRVSAARAGATSAAIRADRRRYLPLRAILPASPDLGVRDRQVHDRSDLVALSLLGAGLPQSQPRHEPASRSGRRSS